MAIKMPSREEMLAGLRKKHAERQQNRKDPDEFRAPKTNPNDVLEYYIRILPELHSDDACKGGTCEIDNDLWFYENGAHWFEQKRYECPRLHAQEQCELCTLGFDLMKDVDDAKARSRISKNYLSKSFYAVNIYFLPITKNPENLRGKVMWFSAPKQIFDKFEACIHNDDVGDAEEPKAAGIFYHPMEGYTFKLVVKNKNSYNNYEESVFIPRSLGPLVKREDGSADEEAIEAILAQRHVLQKKFKPYDRDKLSEICAKLQSNEQGGGNDEQDEEIGNMKGAARSTSAPTKPKAAPKAAPPPVEDETGEETPVEAEAEAEAIGEDAEDAAEAVAESEDEQPEVEGQPTVQPAPASKPMSRPVTTSVKPMAAKPAAPVSAVKPVSKPTVAPAKTQAVKPAAKPVAAAVSGDDDPDLVSIMSAIKSAKKPQA